MYYDLKEEWKLCSRETRPTSDFVAFLSKETALEDEDIRRTVPQIQKIYKEIPFTRAEFYADFLYGMVYIPPLLNHEKVHFTFLMKADRLYFICGTDFLSRQFEQLLELRKNNMSDIGMTLYHLLDFLLVNDLEKINLIQDQLSRLEEQIFDNLHNNYSRRLTEFRSKTLQLSHYYLQLSALTTLINENINSLFTQNQLQHFSLLADRISLLKGEAAQLWDYTSQVREIYQEQLDVHQNEIMKFLTIGTTLFFPLSLITGWYGMNFEHMPELAFAYSYPVLIGISILIVILLIFWFKKKNFW